MGLKECGYSASAIYPRHGHPLSKTRAIGQRFPYSALDPINSLERAIQATDPEIIIPCDDRAVEHLHQLHEREDLKGSSGSEIAQLIERSLGRSAGFSTTASRFELITIATQEGIRVPATWRVSSPQDLKALRPEADFPWVLKVDGSWGGHGVRFAHTPQEAESFYAQMARPLGTARYLNRLIVSRDPYWLQTWWRGTRAGVIAQAYVEGRPANVAVCCWEGELLDGIAAEVVQAQGATGAATVVRVVDGAEMLHAAKLLARRLGLSGFFGLDFMIEEGTSKPYLIEMNPRCTPLSHLALGEGRDLIAGLAAKLSGTVPRARQSVTQNECIAYFPQAWHWDPKSDLLRTSFCDVPWQEPDLVQDLLRVPWPDRSILARLSNQLRGTTFQDRRSRGGMFQPALAGREPADEHRVET
jgi:ATP-grasp domain-containing protein